ncbi:aryl-hydrocarbon-interacting protein-like 1 isoform X1 [Ictalurus furcatus]|uniref:aryl-hydrocarbon-interacting protein-like 1 isoform X1 n=1 Tax=Ictalurus furcatus TaxID=66913 RepID=UPI0023501AE7|nr:aryl-hydrocarbon-interacting protein-like 1 isoform X1 [Ictalurus furcatus]
MEETYLFNHPGVKKVILHGGQGPLPHFPNGTKLVFHFQTLLDNFERTVIDDSRKNKQPTEIFVGKMFKMEVWEVLLTSMRVGEVAEFWCDAIHTGLYPMVAKGIRLAAQGKDPLEGQKHMCGMGNVFTYHSTGFTELDELMREPQPLIFIMELISVGLQTNMHTCTNTPHLQPSSAILSLHLQQIYCCSTNHLRSSTAEKHWGDKLFTCFSQVQQAYLLFCSFSLTLILQHCLLPLSCLLLLR